MGIAVSSIILEKNTRVLDKSHLRVAETQTRILSYFINKYHILKINSNKIYITLKLSELFSVFL